MATESIVSESPASSSSYKMKSLETGPKIPCNENSSDVACKNKDIEKKEQKEDISLVNNDADISKCPQGIQIDKESAVCGKRLRKEDSEEELERLAMDNLLGEAKRNKLRADRLGACGWNKQPRPKTNKRFAKQVINSAVFSNRVITKKKH